MKKTILTLTVLAISTLGLFAQTVVTTIKMKKITLIIIFIFCVNSLLAQYTLIPDSEFEQRLITQGIDTEGILDGQVLTDDIDHITALYIESDPPVFPYIYDLTGIEDFVSLEDLGLGLVIIKLNK